MKKAHNQLALIIKSQRLGERDLLVTLITPTDGKITVIAKGVRQICSQKRACLESGNLLKVLLIETKGLPLLTQATLVASATPLRHDLKHLKKFLLYLEILDQLLVSEELSQALWQKIIYVRELFLQKLNSHYLRPHLDAVLTQLGYHHTKQPLIAQIPQITGRPLHAFDYLTLNTSPKNTPA